MPKPMLTAAQGAKRHHDTGPARAGRDLSGLPERIDIFARVVPVAGLDICLLFNTASDAHRNDPLQLALRGLCALPRQISHATKTPDRIDIRIDGSRLVFGHFNLVPDAPFFRPDLARASLTTGRLGHLLTHHKLAIRLRVDAAASSDLIDEICHLVLGLHPPTAVITLPQRIVLTRTEFQSLPRDDHGTLARATTLTPSPARHMRPTLADDPADIRPAVPKQGQPSHKLARCSVFTRPHGRADPPLQGDPIEQLLTDYHDTRTIRDLRAEFRKSSRWARGPGQLSGRAPAFLKPGTTSSKPARDMLICDAVVIAYGGKMRHYLAPILLATLVALISHTHRAHGPDYGDATARDVTASRVYSA